MRTLPMLLLFCCFALSPLTAHSGIPANGVQIAQNGCSSLSDAVEQVRRRTEGRIVSAETRVKNGREVHHIKVLSKDGKVKTHKVQGCKRGNG